MAYLVSACTIPSARTVVFGEEIKRSFKVNSGHNVNTLKRSSQECNLRPVFYTISWWTLFEYKNHSIFHKGQRSFEIRKLEFWKPCIHNVSWIEFDFICVSHCWTILLIPACEKAFLIMMLHPDLMYVIRLIPSFAVELPFLQKLFLIDFFFWAVFILVLFLIMTIWTLIFLLYTTRYSVV